MVRRAYSIWGWGRTEFSPEVIEMMRSVVKRSEKIGYEIGFLLCKCFGRITPSKEIAIGSHIEIPREKLLATACPRGCEPIGYFHTPQHTSWLDSTSYCCRHSCWCARASTYSLCWYDWKDRLLQDT